MMAVIGENIYRVTKLHMYCTVQCTYHGILFSPNRVVVSKGIIWDKSADFSAEF